jgi:Txe/YoeB family toxin of toxin-antitoxin system
VVSWKVILSRKATKDAKKLSQAGLAPQAQRLLKILQEDPFTSPPFFEKLCGNLSGFYSRRINRQHRLVYDVRIEQKTVHVLRMWSHYE